MRDRTRARTRIWQTSWRPVLVLVVVTSAACARTELYDLEMRATCNTAADCAAGLVCRDGVCREQQAWGDFAATLDVPACPSSNPVLTVNTTADELDGGQSITDPSQAGDYLSFAEAIWIAGSRGTPHNIFFDAQVFPAEAPGVIHVRDHPEMPANAIGLCIDGRRRGVVVEYDDSVLVTPCRSGVSRCDIPLQEGALLVGLTLDNLPNPLAPSASQLAGCRLQADALAVYPSEDFVVGPGNVLEANSALDVRYVSSSEIVRNYFGYDPLTHELLDVHVAVYAFEAVDVRHNIFGSVSTVLQASLTGPGAQMVVHNNYFGVDEYGDSLPAGATGLSVAGFATAGRLQLGPFNTIRGINGDAVSILGPLFPAMTRNVISGNGGGIVYAFETPVTAPVIASVTSTTIGGTCAVAGTLEVFSDPGDQGETFVGAVACDGASSWTLSAAVPGGRNVTATLTDAQLRTSVFSEPVPAP